MPLWRAAEMSSAAAPAALPVFVEPVGPCMEIDDLPPNWVVFAPRKYVAVGTFVPTFSSRRSAMRPAADAWIPVLGGEIRPEALAVGHDALHELDVVVGGGEVVVAGVQVVAGVELRDALAVGVLGGRLGERGVVEAAVGALDDLHAVVGCVGHGHRERVLVRHERVPDPQRGERALRADAEPAGAVVALLGDLVRAAGPVVARGEVARLVERVVVVVEEVPARDVVDVAVAVGVGAVGERLDEVLAGRGVATCRRNPGVPLVVVDVERPAVVLVPGRHRSAGGDDLRALELAPRSARPSSAALGRCPT